MLLCKSISLTSLRTKDNIIEKKEKERKKREKKRKRSSK